MPGMAEHKAGDYAYIGQPNHSASNGAPEKQEWPTLVSFLPPRLPTKRQRDLIPILLFSTLPRFEFRPYTRQQKSTTCDLYTRRSIRV